MSIIQHGKARRRDGRFVSKRARIMAPVLLLGTIITPSFFSRGEPKAQPLISPVVMTVQATEPHDSPIVFEKSKMEAQDQWIGEAADKYANKSKSASKLRYQLHCLAYKENGHHANNKCGDGGKSCGMYQYRKGTWEGFRKQMIKAGLVKEIGSLWDDQEAINTTAWALVNGKETHWGPIVNKRQCL